MPKKSAGIILYRFYISTLQVLLVHPGGPFWAKKDAGAWSIPKGEFEPDEEPLAAAIRELEEETGLETSGPFVPLEPVKQKSGKLIYAWATPLDVDVTTIRSNSFEMDWPPGSGKKRSFPEVDRAAWFDTMVAMEKINEGQRPLITGLIEILALTK